MTYTFQTSWQASLLAPRMLILWMFVLGGAATSCTEGPGSTPTPALTATPEPSSTPNQCTPQPPLDPTPTPVPVSCNTKNESCAPYTCNAEGAPTMLPGSNCQSCHSPGNLPEDLTGAPTARQSADDLNWSIAGTAFADIVGSSQLSGAVVKVTDSTGKVVSLTTNRAGNFYSNTPMTPPLTAQITADGQTYEMASPVDTGACNSCHTCNGTPGGKLYGGLQPTPVPTPEPTPALCIPATPVPVTFSNINSEILQPTCATSNCHSKSAAAGGLSLESSNAYSNLVNVNATQLPSMKLVAPADTANSYFWHKVKGDQSSVGGGGGTMPIGSTLSNANLERIQQWISEGAPNN